MSAGESTHHGASLVVVTTSKLCVFVYTHDVNMCIIMYIHVYKYNPLVYIRRHWEGALVQ